eukprot:366399-Chlamydomonas_euryale.AAC.55
MVARRLRACPRALHGPEKEEGGKGQREGGRGKGEGPEEEGGRGKGEGPEKEEGGKGQREGGRGKALRRRKEEGGKWQRGTIKASNNAVVLACRALRRKQCGRSASHSWMRWTSDTMRAVREPASTLCRAVSTTGGVPAWRGPCCVGANGVQGTSQRRFACGCVGQPDEPTCLDVVFYTVLHQCKLMVCARRLRSCCPLATAEGEGTGEASILALGPIPEGCEVTLSYIDDEAGFKVCLNFKERRLATVPGALRQPRVPGVQAAQGSECVQAAQGLPAHTDMCGNRHMQAPSSMSARLRCVTTASGARVTSASETAPAAPQLWPRRLDERDLERQLGAQCCFAPVAQQSTQALCGCLKPAPPHWHELYASSAARHWSLPRFIRIGRLVRNSSKPRNCGCQAASCTQPRQVASTRHLPQPHRALAAWVPAGAENSVCDAKEAATKRQVLGYINNPHREVLIRRLRMHGQRCRNKPARLKQMYSMALTDKA